MLRAGLIGFGGIAVAHREGFARLKKEGMAELVCACDINPEAFGKKLTINLDTESTDFEENINFYTDIEELLKKEKVDFFDVCVPSFLHSEISTKLLRLGYHVMCEKPMSLTSDDCEKMLDAAKESGKQLMIGQCVRFYPEFDYIKKVIDDGRFGKVLNGYFERLSAPPGWGWENWFMTPERSGGCITDLHIHDIDIIRYLFGDPDAVSCYAKSSICIHDSVHTSLFYGDTQITAIGDWTLNGMPFKASARISFESATVNYENSVLTVYPKNNSKSYAVPIEKTNAYYAELCYFCRIISGEIKNEKNPATSAAKTLKLIEKMRISADNSAKIIKL